MTNLVFKSYKGRKVEDGQEVFVYRNLHNDLWSIKMAKKPYHVLGHAEVVTLDNCELVVSESGRRRVLNEQKKNVHAGVRGKFVRDYTTMAEKEEYVAERFRGYEITYNPYKYESFVRVDNKERVTNANKVLLTKSKRVYALEG